MTSPPELSDDGQPAAAFEDPATRVQDDEENAGIPSGYTYLGQFIDHDITFDPASSLQQENDPDALIDYRTPRLDLNSLYGRGPADQPYMYLGKKFRLGNPLKELARPTNVRDLPRFADPNDPSGPKRALIGDKRNDENVIVSQLHAAMLQFHNKLVDEQPELSFEDVQQQVRWHYQWIVVNDYLDQDLRGGCCSFDPAPSGKGRSQFGKIRQGSRSTRRAMTPTCRWSSRSRPSDLGTRWCGRSTV